MQCKFNFDGRKSLTYDLSTSFTLHCMPMVVIHAVLTCFCLKFSTQFELVLWINSFNFTDIFQNKISPIHTWVWTYKCMSWSLASTTFEGEGGGYQIHVLPQRRQKFIMIFIFVADNITWCLSSCKNIAKSNNISSILLSHTLQISSLAIPELFVYNATLWVVRGITCSQYTVKMTSWGPPI